MCDFFSTSYIVVDAPCLAHQFLVGILSVLNVEL